MQKKYMVGGLDEKLKWCWGVDVGQIEEKIWPLGIQFGPSSVKISNWGPFLENQLVEEKSIHIPFIFILFKYFFFFWWLLLV